MFCFSTGDSMASHNGKAFSTKDRDNDQHESANCAAGYKGAWWYYGCHAVNINGLYVGNKVDNNGMRWAAFKGSQSMKTTSMMMRRTSNNN
jgi:ficolin